MDKQACADHVNDLLRIILTRAREEKDSCALAELVRAAAELIYQADRALFLG